MHIRRNNRDDVTNGSVQASVGTTEAILDGHSTSAVNMNHSASKPSSSQVSARTIRSLLCNIMVADLNPHPDQSKCN